ncbi:uncharacterized protein [Drosophila suzukii]|uniref:Uncharacterized protein n=1 Tax=Drosophila suzukii TaxID=28584 RepID=A0AB39YZJ6_DROSZ|nr:uncharacterized protein LOC108006157 [Drosophila suzukii]
MKLHLLPLLVLVLLSLAEGRRKKREIEIWVRPDQPPDSCPYGNCPYGQT